MALTRESTEVRREQIIKAAVDIIGRDGFGGFTTARLAKEVGISEANLYRHFKNKDAVITAVIDNIEETLLNNLKKVEGEGGSGLEKMERVFKLHLEYIQQNSGIPRIVFSSECLFVKGLQKKLLGFVNEYTRGLAGLIEEGMKDGSIKETVSPEAMAAMFIGIMQFNALRWLLGGFKWSLTEKGEKFWQNYRKHIASKK